MLGVVGESGSGKSVSAMSILRLLDGNGYIDSGEILFNGQDLTKLSMNEMYKIRGNEISVIFQEPMTSLNPVFTVSRQISEPLMIHQGMNKSRLLRKRSSCCPTSRSRTPRSSPSSIRTSSPAVCGSVS